MELEHVFRDPALFFAAADPVRVVPRGAPPDPAPGRGRPGRARPPWGPDVLRRVGAPLGGEHPGHHAVLRRLEAARGAGGARRHLAARRSGRCSCSSSAGPWSAWWSRCAGRCRGSTPTRCWACSSATWCRGRCWCWRAAPAGRLGASPAWRAVEPVLGYVLFGLALGAALEFRACGAGPRSRHRRAHARQSLAVARPKCSSVLHGCAPPSCPSTLARFPLSSSRSLCGLHRSCRSWRQSTPGSAGTSPGATTARCRRASARASVADWLPRSWRWASWPSTWPCSSACPGRAAAGVARLGHAAHRVVRHQLHLLGRSDPRLALALVMSIGALTAIGVMGPSDAERHVSAGVGLGLGGGLFVLLGDDLSLLIAGSVLSGLGALVMAPKAAAARAARGFVVGRLSDAALIGATALLRSGGWPEAGRARATTCPTSARVWWPCRWARARAAA